MSNGRQPPIDPMYLLAGAAAAGLVIGYLANEAENAPPVEPPEPNGQVIPADPGQTDIEGESLHA